MAIREASCQPNERGASQFAAASSTLIVFNEPRVVVAFVDDASGLLLGISRAVRLPFEASAVRQLFVLFADVLVRVNGAPYNPSRYC
jgi:hypothetical protein